MQAQGLWLTAALLTTTLATGCPRPPSPVRTPERPVTTPSGDTMAARRAQASQQAAEPAADLPDGFEVSGDNEAQPGEAGYRITHGETGIEFVWVPAGSFTMGTSKEKLKALWQEWGPAYNAMPHEGTEEDLQPYWRESADTEAPTHEVELDGFWIARTEVSIGQWRKVMGSVPRQEYVDAEDHPVTSISYSDCKAFCGKIGAALPTEAQWEYAARGPESLQYPWGNDWDAGKCQSYPGGHDHEYSAPVGYMADDLSWCGALDMAGNVSEWCRDWFGKGFYATAEASQKNPECTKSGEGRVIRGGSWESEALDCRSAARHWEYPDSSYYLYGLRPAIEVR